LAEFGRYVDIIDIADIADIVDITDIAGIMDIADIRVGIGPYLNLKKIPLSLL